MNKFLLCAALIMTALSSFAQGVKVQAFTTNSGPVVTNIVINLSSNLAPNRLRATNTITGVRVYAATNGLGGFWLDPITISPGSATNVIDVAAGQNITIVTNALLRTIIVTNFNGSGAGLTNLPFFTNNLALWVDVNGSDSNPGTRERPLRTIQAATAIDTPGTVIVVGAGSNFITTSISPAPGGGIVGVGPETHIWGTNNLSLHGPMIVPTDNSYCGNFTMHSDAPFGSYEDVSVSPTPVSATNWIFENFTIWGRPSKFANIDGIVFSAGLTNKGIIRNGTIAGGFDGFSFRDNEVGDPGTYDILIQNVLVELQNINANTVRGFTIRRVNPSKFTMQNVVFVVTNRLFAGDSTIINVVSDTDTNTVIDCDSVRFENLGGTNDITLSSAVTLRMAGGNLPDGRVINGAGAVVLYSPRNGVSLTNVLSAAIIDPTGSGAVVKSNSPTIRNLTVTPDNSATLTAFELSGNQLTRNNSSNFFGGAGSRLVQRTLSDGISTTNFVYAVDEFDGGTIFKYGAGTTVDTLHFEVGVPGFYLTSLGGSGDILGIDADGLVTKTSAAGGGSGIQTNLGSGIDNTFTNASFGSRSDDPLNRVSFTVRANTVWQANSSNFWETLGASLYGYAGNLGDHTYTVADIDEFDGGIIYRLGGANGSAVARSFDVMTPNFYATDLGGSGDFLGISAAGLIYQTNANAIGVGRFIENNGGAGTNIALRQVTLGGLGLAMTNGAGSPILVINSIQGISGDVNLGLNGNITGLTFNTTNSSVRGTNIDTASSFNLSNSFFQIFGGAGAQSAMLQLSNNVANANSNTVVLPGRGAFTNGSNFVVTENGNITNSGAITMTSATAQFLASEGTAANPGIARRGDADDGIVLGETTVFYRDGNYAAGISLSAGNGSVNLPTAASAAPNTFSAIASRGNQLVLGVAGGGNCHSIYAATNLTADQIIVTNHFRADLTITAGGTTGDRTINKSAGTVNFAAGTSAITVTCDKCTTSSLIFAECRANDTTAQVKNVVPGSGSFVINLVANATAETSVGFFIVNSP